MPITKSASPVKVIKTQVDKPKVEDNQAVTPTGVDTKYIDSYTTGKAGKSSAQKPAKKLPPKAKEINMSLANKFAGKDHSVQIERVKDKLYYVLRWKNGKVTRPAVQLFEFDASKLPLNMANVLAFKLSPEAKVVLEKNGEMLKVVLKNNNFLPTLGEVIPEHYLVVPADLYESKNSSKLFVSFDIELFVSELWEWVQSTQCDIDAIKNGAYNNTGLFELSFWPQSKSPKSGLPVKEIDPKDNEPEEEELPPQELLPDMPGRIKITGNPKFVEIVIAIDITNSMSRATELAIENLGNDVKALKKKGVKDIKIGVVTFRDEDEVKIIAPMTSMNAGNIGNVFDTLGKIEAADGRDKPEAVGEAIAKAAKMFSNKADSEKFVMVITDKEAVSAGEDSTKHGISITKAKSLCSKRDINVQIELITGSLPVPLKEIAEVHKYVLLGDKEKLLELAKKSPHEHVQVKAVGALAAMGEEKWIKVLLELADKNPDKKIRIEAVEALAVLGLDAESELLYLAESGSDEIVRVKAANVLARSGVARGTAILVKLARFSTKADVRSEAVYALAYLNPKVAIKTLRSIVTPKKYLKYSKIDNAILEAADALFALDPKAGVKALNHLHLEYKDDKQVQEKLIGTIKKLTEQNPKLAMDVIYEIAIVTDYDRVGDLIKIAKKLPTKGKKDKKASKTLKIFLQKLSKKDRDVIKAIKDIAKREPKKAANLLYQHTKFTYDCGDFDKVIAAINELAELDTTKTLNAAYYLIVSDPDRAFDKVLKPIAKVNPQIKLIAGFKALLKKENQIGLGLGTTIATGIAALSKSDPEFEVNELYKAHGNTGQWNALDEMINALQKKGANKELHQIFLDERYKTVKFKAAKALVESGYKEKEILNFLYDLVTKPLKNGSGQIDKETNEAFKVLLDIAGKTRPTLLKLARDPLIYTKPHQLFSLPLTKKLHASGTGKGQALLLWFKSMTSANPDLAPNGSWVEQLDDAISYIFGESFIDDSSESFNELMEYITATIGNEKPDISYYLFCLTFLVWYDSWNGKDDEVETEGLEKITNKLIKIYNEDGKDVLRGLFLMAWDTNSVKTLADIEKHKPKLKRIVKMSEDNPFLMNKLISSYVNNVKGSGEK